MTTTAPLDPSIGSKQPTVTASPRSSVSEAGRWRRYARRGALTAVAATTLVLAPALQSAGAVTVSGVVPNMFYRTCSNFTGRCTGYHQTNGPFNANYPSRYYTTNCWCWV